MHLKDNLFLLGLSGLWCASEVKSPSPQDLLLWIRLHSHQKGTKKIKGDNREPKLHQGSEAKKKQS